jgi:hypothetical protein
MTSELSKRIAKQNAKTERQMGFYALGMKNVTRVTFSRNAQWNQIDTTKVYYAQTKLQA